MRILTYSSPFEINAHSDVWDIVTKHPHFCASDTLVQGLEAEYGRTSFGVLRSISALLNRAFEPYMNNPQNDIQIFLTVSNIIRSMDDGALKSAFRFNIADVVEAVKFLAVLQCQTNKFHADELSSEQSVLLHIYDQVMASPAMDVLKDLKHLTKSDFINAVRCTFNDEIEYLCNKNPEYVEQAGIHFPLKYTRDGYTAATALLTHLTSVMQEAPVDDFKPQPHQDDITRLNHIINLMTDEDDSVYEKIVVHGVHKITPIMYLLFQLLEGLGIEVIFLINYAANLPNIYQTWKTVYSWCDTKFEYAEDLDVTKGQRLGLALAGVIEGKNLSAQPTECVTIYNNLTAFTAREVKPTFERTYDRMQKGHNLNKMHTQYYAVSGESSNEVLKMYFPEQFNQKPFLSYPIGQFILGIYQMWDFEEGTLKLSEQSLCECAVSNLYKARNDINIFEVINKTKLYFSDIETVQDYYERIASLEVSLQIIARNNRYAPLEKLSFFNITFQELNAFKAFLEFIEDIASKLFVDADESVDFGKHFKMLMEIISIPSVNNNTLSKTEQALIAEITAKLTQCTEGEVHGNVADVKDALCYYLAGSKKGDTSNWIVRDFEQIDGAVLMRKRTKARYNHFAFLSNSNMTSQNNDALPWPLTEAMFTGYLDASSAVPVVTMGLLERRNFLKFTLFYGVFFSAQKIKLSYIAEENGEEQKPYYLLSVLGLKTSQFDEQGITSFDVDDDDVATSKAFHSQSVGAQEREFFAICPYKYLQNAVLKAPIEYSNEYHVKYFVSNFMYAFIKGLYGMQSSDLQSKITHEFQQIKKLFPFWGKSTFLDIERNTRGQLNAYTFHGPQAELMYEQRKENFLIAQWENRRTNKKHMNFTLPDMDAQLTKYMNAPDLYPRHDALPHEKVCENCNFNEVCLRNYYNANAQIEGED